MTQTLALEKTLIEEILARLENIENLLNELLQGEIVTLSPTAKKRFKKIEEDIKKGANLYEAKSFTEFKKLLDS